MIEEIGKVKLDYSRYPGEDFYCDGAVEDELLDIVKTLPPEEYVKVVEERNNWPILYHLSPLRQNIIEWIPMRKDAKVLEVGSGCGAVTGALAGKAGSVTCVDLSKKRSQINAYRNRQCDNITIHVGNFKDIEPELPRDFDFIFLIGVFEYGQSYIGGNTPYHDFLKILLPHLAPGGRLVIAIENKYGLKYFAGCKEDHLGTYFSGIENYAGGGGVRTFSRNGLEQIFESCGVEKYQFYYPYPDYKFMTTLYSDARQPGRGELVNNARNFDRDRMQLFDEKDAFDGIAEDELFSVFSNSILAVVGDGFDTEFVRYSNERAPQYAIRTEIGRDSTGERVVRKYPFGSAAREHVSDMAAAYEKLAERYQGGKLEINKCRLAEDESGMYACFEFVQGVPLTELLDDCLKRDDLEGFYGYFQRYLECISYNESFPFVDYDLIFSNILVDTSRDKWTLIDYEWTVDVSGDSRELAFRAVYCYLLENKKREKIRQEVILDRLGISEEDAQVYREVEMKFQRAVTGNRATLAQIRDRIGNSVTDLQEMTDRYHDLLKVNRVQIFEDRGEGCSEKESYFAWDAFKSEKLIELELHVDGEVELLRIDPGFLPCAVRVQEMTFNGKDILEDWSSILSANGRIMMPVEQRNGRGCPVIVLPTEDPNVNVDLRRLERRKSNILWVRMEMEGIILPMAQSLADFAEAYEDRCRQYEEIKQECADREAQIAELTAQAADLEAKRDELDWKLNRIVTNPLWKLSKPARSCFHWASRQKNRLKNCGGPRGVLHKIGYKKREREAMKQFGTASFPSQEQAAAEASATFPYMPKVSILVPLWNNQREFQIEMLDSVMTQTYQNWELCLADGSDGEHGYIGDICEEYAARSGGRIVYRKLEKNDGISGNTNACLQMATGEYIGLLDQDDILHPSVLYEYVKAINQQGADYLYCDETTFKSGNINHMLTMHFKPDYAPDNLRANNYICHFSVFKKDLLDGNELFRTKYDGSQDHDMILRLTDNAKKVVHVPRLMYYWRSHAGSTAASIEAKPYAIQAAKEAVSEHLRKNGFGNFRIESTRAFETIFRIRYQVMGMPRISIIIANRDHMEDLERCISSILNKSTYGNYEIIIVENNSTTQEIRDSYGRLLGCAYDPDQVQHSPDGRITIVTYKGEFNYSAVNNLGVQYATGEYILLLNNDTSVITVNWMEELLMYAQREDVGAVGAKLYYEDRTIQHAGVVIGLGAHRTAGHTHYKQPRQNLGYMGRLCYAQNVTAVTGACLLVKKELYMAVGGLDEGFAISLNDVDFCLKLRERGYLNVFTPFAELYHYESVSRGLDDSGEKAERYNKESEKFREKWKKVLEAGDPYYNPNFSLDRSDYSLKIKG